MAQNNISTLATNGVADKQKRQLAKLNLASEKRTQTNNPRPSYDITQLPTQWQFDAVNILFNNPNTTGLIAGRPWISLFALFVPQGSESLITSDGDTFRIRI